MSAFIVRKGKDNQFHLVGHFSNRWRDDDFHADPEHGGEIVAADAHKEYEKWLDKNPQHAPELWVWHTWGSAFKGRAEWWGFSGNFFWMSWPLTEKEAKGVQEWAAEEDLGMSFGFYALKYDVRDAVIERYRAFEASILPRDAAANKWTGISLVEDKFKGVKMLSEKKLEALRKVHGDGVANQLKELDQQMSEFLDAAGIDSKEAEAAEAEAGETTPAAAAPEAKVEAEVVDAPAKEAAVDEELVVGALKRLETVLGGDIQKLAERLGAVESELAEAKVKLGEMEAREEQEAKAAAMPASILAAYVPMSILDSGETRKDNAAVVDGRSALAKSQPAAAGTYANKLLGI